MGKHSRWSDLASSASWHPRGQVLELDLCQGPRQDSTCNTYVLEYNPAQRRVGQAAAQALCLHIPSHLLRRTSKWNLVLLASPGAGVATVEGNAIQGGGGGDGRDQMYGTLSLREIIGQEDLWSDLWGQIFDYPVLYSPHLPAFLRVEAACA